MKHSAIFVAAAIASTSVLAQSSVTLGGIIDTGFERTASANEFGMTHSRSGTSNWTISGSEDLGGGMRANFKASTYFNSDNGVLAANNAFGNNDMFLELAGGFGSVKLGRTFDPVFSHALTANGTKGVTGYNTLGTGLANRGVYVNNQLLYTSPKFGPVTGQFSYAPSEVAGQKAHTGFGLRYAEGKLTATLAASKAAGVGQKYISQAAAAYDFGVARVLFTYQNNAALASNADGAWALGVTVPTTSGLVWASYDTKEMAGKDGVVFQLGYKHFLSKRTQLYVQMGSRNSTAPWGSSAAALAANPGASTGMWSDPKGASTGYGFGIAHVF